MTKEKTKAVKLRAFKIISSNITKLTEPGSGILKLLSEKLSDSSTAQERRRLRNKADNDEDLLSSFEWQADNSYLFGMMLRIMPGESGGQIDEKLFSHKKITISDIEAGKEGTFQPKEMFYFALNDDFIVTNLSGTYSISGFQTYINWLLESLRGKHLFDFNPVMTLRKGIPFSDVRSVVVGDSINISVGEGIGERLTMKGLFAMIIRSIIDSTGNLDDVQLEELISAELRLKPKGKPKGMQEETYKRFMGTLIKPATDDDSVRLILRDGSSFDGKEIAKTRIIDKIETTSTGRLDEGQLKQEMERFLNELNEEQHVATCY